MTLRRGRFVRATLATSVAAALGPLRANAAPMEARDMTVAAPNLFPESVAYVAATQRFYIGSLRYGRVSSLDASGTLRTLSDDPTLVSTFGLFGDVKSGLLYVCNTDVGVSARSTPATIGRMCRLVALDTASGKLVRNVDVIGSLPGKHQLNDGVIASDGSVYLTDMAAPLIHRISPNGEATVFVKDDGFDPGPGGYGLDGIALAATGTLVVNHLTQGTFWRVDSASKAVSRVKFAGDRLFVGSDGMRIDDGRLVVSQSVLGGPTGRNFLNTYTTTDDWHSADLVAEHPLSKTTYQTVRTPAGVYGVQSGLEALFKDPKTANVPGFTLAVMPG